MDSIATAPEHNSRVDVVRLQCLHGLRPMDLKHFHHLAEMGHGHPDCSGCPVCHHRRQVSLELRPDQMLLLVLTGREEEKLVLLFPELTARFGDAALAQLEHLVAVINDADHRSPVYD